VNATEESTRDFISPNEDVVRHKSLEVTSRWFYVPGTGHWERGIGEEKLRRSDYPMLAVSPAP